MKRILTALALLPLVLYVVLWGPLWSFFAVLTTVALICYYEYAGIAAAYGFGSLGPLGYGVGLWLLLLGDEPLLLLTLLLLSALALSLRLDDLAKALPRSALLLAGVVYVFGCWRYAVLLRNASPYWLLFAMALSWVGDIAAYYIGRSLGKLLPDAEKTDCRGMCVGPRGTVWAAVWGSRGNEGALHLVRKSPQDAAPRDLGAVSVSNPDYTPFVDADGKPLPYHHGFRKTPEGVFTPLYHMGIAETEDGRVYMLVIDPYTVLEFDVPK